MSKTLAKIIDQKTSSLRRRYSFCFCCVHDLESSSSLKVVQATGWTVNNVLLSSSRAFSLSTPMGNSAVCQLQSFFIVLGIAPLFRCLPLWTTVRLHGKKLQNATNKMVNNTKLNAIHRPGGIFIAGSHLDPARQRSFSFHT